jgi:hypothetical protein
MTGASETKGAYFVQGDLTENKSSIRIKIPKANLFDCTAVNDLLKSAFELSGL